jgi:diguanylate cyclase (GGDEF)-like protein
MALPEYGPGGLASRLVRLDSLLVRMPRWWVMVIGLISVALIATLDYATGYEISLSLLYLAPVAMVSWYGGKQPGIALAILSCICWLVADIAAGHDYQHWTIPIWNALVRLGFFLSNGLLLASMRKNLDLQRQLARTDALTGAYTRRVLEERLDHDSRIARRRRYPITVAILDLDNFKHLNDNHGHPAGDRALREMTRLMQSFTRDVDTVARIGGDEFVLLLPDTDRQYARDVILRLRSGLSQVFATIAPGVTCSIGAVTFMESPPNLREVLRVADALLYDAKQHGKNMATFSTIAWDGSLNSAIARDMDRLG